MIDDRHFDVFTIIDVLMSESKQTDRQTDNKQTDRQTDNMYRLLDIRVLYITTIR